MSAWPHILLYVLLNLSGALMTACSPSSQDSNTTLRAYATGDFAAALTAGDGSANILFAAPTTYTSAQICVDLSGSDCQENSTAFKALRADGIRGDRSFFSSDQAVTLRHELVITLRVLDKENKPAGNLKVKIQDRAQSSPSIPLAGFDPGPMPKKYLSIADIQALIRNWEGQGKGFLQTGSIGKIRNTEQMYLRMSSAVSTGAKLPSILIQAGIHGNESIAVATIVGVMNKLLADYGKDPAVTELINTRDIYFIPVLCVDGYAANSREVEGKDPNRTYPYPGNPNNDSVTCTANIIKFFEAKFFNAAVDYHASGRMMMYPWGYTRERLKGEKGKVYQRITSEMAKLSGYRQGQIPDLVGYESPGSSADYYHIHGEELGIKTYAMGVEVGTDMRPPTSEIATEVDRNYKALQYFVKEAPVAFSNVTYSLVGDAPPPYIEGENHAFLMTHGRE